jgi:hypothetical protein
MHGRAVSHIEQPRWFVGKPPLFIDEPRRFIADKHVLVAQPLLSVDGP